jgi:PTH1 family peptidyl-tRNA hydrolase
MQRGRIPRPALQARRLRMKVIAALGNPGREYEATRHNAAWWFVDHLARRWHFDSWKRDGESLAVTGLVGGKRVKLIKPQTYMNLSGSVLRAYPRREGFDIAQDLLVMVDEVAISIGEYRFKPFGSAGGHNGLKSVEAHLKTQKYPRLRIGIRSLDERRLGGDLADYVLNVMPRDERVVVEENFERMAQAVEIWISEGTEKAVSTMGR